MQAVGRLSRLTLALGASLSATMIACGGKTTENSQIGSSGGLSGSAGSGANGGSVVQGGATVVAPRTPTTHRSVALSCVGVNSPPEPSFISTAMPGTCKLHSDCTAGANGKCVSGVGMMGATYNCVYDQCATDADCGSGMVCYCTATSAARCLAIGNCRIDADCGGGNYSYCSPSMSWVCGGYRPIDGYHCHTPADSCLDDTECTGTDYCNFDVYEARWKCTATNTSCIIG